jgi:alpha/beta superfamily hydrolase
MAPDNKILGVISKEDKMAEIQRRLQDQETQKARQLLAAATSHFEALKIAKNIIEEQIEKASGSINGANKRK